VTLPRTGSAPPEATGYRAIQRLPLVVVAHLHFPVIIVVAGTAADAVIEVDEQPPEALHLQPPHVVLKVQRHKNTTAGETIMMWVGLCLLLLLKLHDLERVKKPSLQ
jgi:hypothetical protein